MTTSTNPPVNPLADILTKYAVPDPKIVGKLPKGGSSLSYVGHADITRILIDIDPTWRLVPIAWENGRPAMNIVNDMATMWFELTLLGTSRLAIGSAKSNSPDLDKVLYGDALRNGAMRFGISLSLWTKQEWEDLDHNPSSVVTTTRATGQAQQRNISSQPAEPVDTDAPLTQEQIEAFNAACGKAELSPVGIYRKANVKFGLAKQSDLAALRKSYKEACTNAPTKAPAGTEE